jgi:hypothetical protein
VREEKKEKDVLSLSLSFSAVVVVVVVLGVYLTQVKVSSRLDWEKKTSGLGMVLGEGFVVFSLSLPLLRKTLFSLSLSLLSTEFRTARQLR